MKHLRIIGKWLAILLALLVLISAIIVALEVRVDLSALKLPMEAAARQILGREVRLQGRVSLTPTLWPVVEIENVEIDNPPNWKGGVFARAGRLRLKLGLMPLLRGKIHVEHILGDTVTANLANNPQGVANWRFIGESDQPKALETPAKEEPYIELHAVDNIELNDIKLSYRDQKLEQQFQLELDELRGKLPWGQDFVFNLRGRFQGAPFRVALKGGGMSVTKDMDQSWPVSLDAEIAGTPVKMEGELPPGDATGVEASMEVGAVDFGALLSWLGMIEGVEATAEGLSLSVVLQGESLTELLSRSTLEMSLHKATWILEDVNSSYRLPIQVPSGRFLANPQEPLKLEIDGRLGQSAVSIVITGAQLADYLEKGVELPIVVDIATADAQMRLESMAKRPLNLLDLGFAMNLKGKSLGRLNQLTGLDLPPLGPYALSGRFALEQDGYHLRGLRIDVRDSVMSGDLSYLTASQPPRLEVALKSERLRIDDFDLGDWSPETDPTGPDAGSDSKRGSEGAVELLSQEFLNGRDANVTLEVEQVLSGNDKLGSGMLEMKLANGRLLLEPLEINLPGGSAWLSFLYHPRANETEVHLQSRVDKFDYGILARRIQGDSPVGGRIGLDIDLSARVTGLEQLLQNSSGHFDFGIWPKGLDAALFDLWAVNLMTSVMGRVDGNKGSEVNCVILRLDMKDGIMADRLVYADTTNMSVAGKLEADFRKRKVQVRAVPKAKRPEFFSLATPVGMKGSFDDFKVRINPVELTGTLFTFITSPLHVPIRRVLGESVPTEDGREACRLAWESDGKPSESSPAQ